MDGLTQLLLAKYAPDKLQEPVVITKAEAEPVWRLTIKSAPEALQEVSGMVIVMSSNDYSESTILKELREFNSQHLELMSRSFTLPISQHGIPAGSWVFMVQEKND